MIAEADQVTLLWVYRRFFKIRTDNSHIWFNLKRLQLKVTPNCIALNSSSSPKAFEKVEKTNNLWLRVKFKKLYRSRHELCEIKNHYLHRTPLNLKDTK